MQIWNTCFFHSCFFYSICSVWLRVVKDCALASKLINANILYNSQDVISLDCFSKSLQKLNETCLYSDNSDFCHGGNSAQRVLECHLKRATPLLTTPWIFLFRGLITVKNVNNCKCTVYPRWLHVWNGCLKSPFCSWQSKCMAFFYYIKTSKERTIERACKVPFCDRGWRAKLPI